MIGFEHITRVPMANEVYNQPPSWDTQLDIGTLHSLNDISVQIPVGYGQVDEISALEYFNLEQAWGVSVACGIVHAFLFLDANGTLWYEYVHGNIPIEKSTETNQGSIYVTRETAATITELLANKGKSESEKADPADVLVTFGTELVSVATDQIEYMQSKDGKITKFTVLNVDTTTKRTLREQLANSQLKSDILSYGAADTIHLSPKTAQEFLSALGFSDSQLNNIPLTQLKLTINWDYRSSTGFGLRIVLRST